MFTLYYTPNTCALASHIALEQAGAVYETVRVDFAANEQRGTRWADDPAAIAEMQRKAPQAVSECFELIERGMLKGPWVMGETYSICDMYLFTLAQWLEADGVDTSKLPRVMDHRRRMSEHLLVRKIIAAELG